MKPVTTTMTGQKSYSQSLARPQDFLDRLERVKAVGKNQWLASCPTSVHTRGDINPSLSVTQVDDRLLLHCHAGCTSESIVHSVGLELADLFFDDRRVPIAPHKTSVSKPQANVKQCEAKPFTDALHIKFWQRLEQLKEVPKALQGRGFTLDDCKVVGIAANGDDAVLAITDPLVGIVSLKQRRHVVKENQSRYFYLTKDCGTPAWCSPCFFTAEKVLLVEGELNAMAAALSRKNNDPDFAMMGIAGVNGQLWLESLKGKDVYVFADGDEPGQQARERWSDAAVQADASKVFNLKPLPDLQDFCDVFAKQGRDYLREELLGCLS